MELLPCLDVIFFTGEFLLSYGFSQIEPGSTKLMFLSNEMTTSISIF